MDNIYYMAIKVAAPSKVCTVFARQNAVVLYSNPTRSTSAVCIYSLFVMSSVGNLISTG
jgi:hypothetical protein